MGQGWINHDQLEGWRRVNYIKRETGTRYVLSEVIQISSLLTMWRSLGKKILSERVKETKFEE